MCWQQLAESYEGKRFYPVTMEPPRKEMPLMAADEQDWLAIQP
jgi:hypothetical protein